MVVSGDQVYIFGGANDMGPNKELFKLDLKSKSFTLIKT